MLTTRTLGTQGLTVFRLAMQLGCTFLDTALAPDKVSGPRDGGKAMSQVDR